MFYLFLSTKAQVDMIIYKTFKNKIHVQNGAPKIPYLQK